MLIKEEYIFSTIKNRYQIDNKTIYNNINTMNYIGSPKFIYKFRLQESGIIIKNQPPFIKEEEFYNSDPLSNKNKLKINIYNK